MSGTTFITLEVGPACIAILISMYVIIICLYVSQSTLGHSFNMEKAVKKTPVKYDLNLSGLDVIG